MTAYHHDIDAEPGRLRALEATGLLRLPAPEEFQEICLLARDRFRVPVALITLVGEDRLIMKAGVGVDLREAPRLQQFCDQAIRREEVLVVRDARADPKFAAHPLVAGPPFLRFYAGAPLAYVRGIRLGTLCLFDTCPTEFSAEDEAELERMADGVMGAVLEREFVRISAEVQ